MRNEEDLNPAERELEESLGRLRPAPVALRSEQVAFEVGRTFGNQQVWRWRMAAALMAVGLLTAVVWRPARVERIVYVDRIQPGPESPQMTPKAFDAASGGGMVRPGDGSYLVLRQQVLERGLDALPPVQVSWSAPTPSPWGISDNGLDKGQEKVPTWRRKLSMLFGGQS